MIYCDIRYYTLLYEQNLLLDSKLTRACVVHACVVLDARAGLNVLDVGCSTQYFDIYHDKHNRTCTRFISQLLIATRRNSEQLLLYMALPWHMHLDDTAQVVVLPHASIDCVALLYIYIYIYIYVLSILYIDIYIYIYIYSACCAIRSALVTIRIVTLVLCASAQCIFMVTWCSVLYMSPKGVTSQNGTTNCC